MRPVAVLLAFLLGLALPAAPARATEAVLFVTDWSNSMNATADGGILRSDVTRAIIDSYLTHAEAAGSGNSLGLVTFGNSRPLSRANRAICETDVTLRVGASTAFGAARRQLPAELARTRAQGFTPVLSAVASARDHALRLLESGAASAVRIVLITDLADSCAGGVSRELRSRDDYCQLGTAIARQMDAGLEKYRDVYKLEFVVAVGDNAANLAELSKCLKAEALAANSPSEARDAGKSMSDRHKTPLVARDRTVVLTFRPAFVGDPDILGRAPGTGQGALTYHGRTGDNPFDLPAGGRALRAPAGTAGTVSFAPLTGVADSRRLDVLFDTDRTVGLPWRLPRVALVAGAPVTLVLRAEEGGAETVLAVAGRREVSILPGRYRVVAGFDEGGIAVRDIVVEQVAQVADVRLDPPAPHLSANWTAERAAETGLPGSLGLRIDGGGVASGGLGLPFGQTVTAPLATPPRGATLSLSRDGRVVWTAPLTDAGAADRRVAVSGGFVWVTARAGRDGEWRLDDLTGGSPVTARFRGSLFDRPLPPGRYRLFFDGTEVCDEGQSFLLAIGGPADFGTFPNWTKGACG